ncbi:MAG: DUF1150 family protein [Alphaproteobacteria bacterium]|nr:DUF1150 family protein [Alphaproteobacteria bacterium]
MINKHSDAELIQPRELLKNLSSRDFLNFGLEQVAYIRPIRIDGQSAFAVHGADGTPIAVSETMDGAVINARHNDLEPFAVN